MRPFLLFEGIWNHRTKKRWPIYVVSMALFFVVYVINFISGGSGYATTELVYIPLLFVVVGLGLRAGLIATLFAGILFGPLMPDEIVILSFRPFYAQITELQAPEEWVLRMAIYFMVTILLGSLVQLYRRNQQRENKLYLYHRGSIIPNIHFLETIHNAIDKESPCSIFSIRILNHEQWIDHWGYEFYQSILEQIYRNVKSAFVIEPYVMLVDADKFWVVKPLVDPLSDQRMCLDALNQSIVINDIPVHPEFAVGYHQREFMRQCTDPLAFREADFAAKKARDARAPLAVYQKEAMESNVDQELKGYLARAIDDGQTFLVYQPKIDLNSGKTIGFEALMRWKHPLKGLIPPNVFIPLIEGTHLIHALTEWVLDRVLDQIGLFQSRGLQVPISFNVSAKNFYDPAFFERCHRRVVERGIDPSLVELEFSEATLMALPDQSAMILKLFQEAGYGCSLDNFGKGISSLSYLSRFSLDAIKLDAYFIRHIETDAAFAHIVESVIQLAHRLGFKVVAEGIEDPKIAALVKQFGCDYAQGYLYAKPLAKEDAESWFLDHS
jgi:diguanylate cyclase